MTPFGQHLRDLRKQSGVHQKDMAQAIGVSAAYLSALEHGQRGKPSYALIQRIVGYFNIIWDDAERLHDLANLSNPRVVIDTSQLSAQATELANVLERKLASLSEQEIGLLKATIEDL